ncbi:MAG: DUF3857 domain-containing protein, partial [Chlamydiae bacterium]|nr:DUF3857 domain-containing protein [Chlamydiota bacterium]
MKKFLSIFFVCGFVFVFLYGSEKIASFEVMKTNTQFTQKNGRPPTSGPASFAAALPFRKDIRLDLLDQDITLNEDQTYTMIITQDFTYLTVQGVLQNQTIQSPSFYPKEQSVTLLEATITYPNGQVLQIPKTNVFTTTSPADPMAPGIITSLIQTVAPPKPSIGSKVHLKWKYNQLTPPGFPFANVTSPVLDVDTIQTRMRVTVPEKMYVKWAQRGNFAVNESVVN